MGTRKKYKWRMYADNNIAREIVDYLRRAGIDVLWISEVPELKRQQEDTFHYRKAAQFKRYLLTHDLDFWNDRKHPLKESPGTIIVATDDLDVGKQLPVVLETLLSDYNPMAEPIYLDGIKIKVDAEGITMKFVDHDTQKVTIESWKWTDLL
jgi:predicted nuclease of predicted toxin-antitoxin system